MLLTPREIAAADRRRQDFDDLMLELAGGSWKIPRFLTKGQIERIREQAGLVPHESIAGVTWREYLELFDRIHRQIYAVSRAIDRAFRKSQQRLDQAREALEDIRRRATVDAKGRKVYRTADRTRAFTDDGEELSSAEMTAIEWNPGAPTWEQRQEAGLRFKEAQEAHDEILRAKERAEYYNDRMACGDVLTRDELETIHQDLNAMPEAVRAEMPGKMAQAMNAPLSEAFCLSAEELADIRLECVSAPRFPLNFPC